MKKWKILSSELVFDNKWFKVQKDVVELPTGKIMDDYYMWKNNDVSLVVAITPNKKILLERQYKHAIRDFVVEVPAGICEDNEEPIKTAERELLEETGYKGNKISLLANLANNPTKEIGRTNIFLVENAEKVSEPNLEEDEDVEVFQVSIKEALQMVYDGKIWITGTISAVILAANKVGYKI